MRTLVAASLLALTAGVLAPTAAPAAPADTPGAATRAAPPQRALAVPGLRITREARGLEHPWDVQPIGNGAFLVTERERKRLLRVKDGRVRRVDFPSGSVWARGETGLMSLEIDPQFRTNRRFYTCQGSRLANGSHEIRVIAWRLNRTQTRATRVEVLLGGIRTAGAPAPGRHAGCRLLIVPGGALLVGTGDAVIGTNPQNLASLNGKVLRLDRHTGRPWPTNPWADASSVRQRYVLTYGHRNVQGLARRRDGTLWSVEHGTDRNDEVNIVRARGNYGWDPAPGYQEYSPMTDHSLPGRQISARWRSGSPTLATSGATWVPGRSGWGSLSGTLAVACLKGSRVLFMSFDKNGVLKRVRTPAALRRYGRLRSISSAPNGDLMITTGNGSGDAVLRVHPRG